MVFFGNVTTDRSFVQKWVEDRAGWPALLPARQALYIGFSDSDASQGLTRISWDEFFQYFEQQQLAFLYRDEAGGEETTPVFKFL
jgi:hypothetical protein